MAPARRGPERLGGGGQGRLLGSLELEELEEPGELAPCDDSLLDVLGLLGPLPPGPLALPLEAPLDDGEPCDVLGVLTGLVGLVALVGLVGVPEGVPPGDEDGVVGPLEPDVPGVLLGPPPEPPTPWMESIWPLGSKRTCAVHGPSGSAAESTKM